MKRITIETFFFASQGMIFSTSSCVLPPSEGNFCVKNELSIDRAHDREKPTSSNPQF